MEEKAKVKKPIFKKWWFWVIVVILIVGIIGGSGDDTKEVNAPESSSREPQDERQQNNNAEPAKEEAKKEAQWIEVIRFEGKSIKDTETFNISSDEWRIVWDTKPGDFGEMNFQIYIYKADGSLESVAANVIGEANDTSYVRGSGDYYLTINTAQPYTIIIEEKK